MKPKIPRPLSKGDNGMTIAEYLALKAKKPSKYRNVKTTVGDIVFDSKREASRWLQLKNDERFGFITKLERQVTFPLIVNGQLICKYKADFVYVENGKRIIEDSKGVRTREYIMKKRLLKATLNLDILET